MVTDKQVKRYRKLFGSGKHTREISAAKAGMTAKTARKWETGPMPSEKPKEARAPRGWRTRKDPLEGYWEAVVLPELQDDPDDVFEATFLFEYLQEEMPGRIADGLLRTFQRRVRDYRAVNGRDKEVFFPQVHQPGKKAQVDFTHIKRLGITIAGMPLDALLFECILCYSGRRHVVMVPSESYEALILGTQGAFQAWGGSPTELWHDHLSAAIHNLRGQNHDQVNERYLSRLDHYNVVPRFIEVAKPNQNGCVERGHGILKNVLRQALKLRRSCDFRNVDEFTAMLTAIVERLNRKRQDRWVEEQALLQPLPATILPVYSELKTAVSKWSLIRVRNNGYSVPASLVGHKVTVRIHIERLEVYYKEKLMMTCPRTVGRGTTRVNYRHIISSLIRKPGAFQNYRYREELFPSLNFRRAYDRLIIANSARADLEYLRILELAARTMESEVEAALALHLETDEPLTADSVSELVAPRGQCTAPDLAQPTPALEQFDNLLSGEMNELLRAA